MEQDHVSRMAHSVMAEGKEGVLVDLTSQRLLDIARQQASRIHLKIPGGQKLEAKQAGLFTVLKLTSDTGHKLALFDNGRFMGFCDYVDKNQKTVGSDTLLGPTPLDLLSEF